MHDLDEEFILVPGKPRLPVSEKLTQMQYSDSSELYAKMYRSIAFKSLSAERKHEISAAYAHEMGKKRNSILERLHTQLAAPDLCMRSIAVINAIIEDYNLWISRENQEIFIAAAHFFEKQDDFDKTARTTRNFRATIPEDKYTSISVLELQPETTAALRELGVMYIGELEVIAHWLDYELSPNDKMAVIDSLKSDKNLLCYNQADVRCSLDEEGKVTAIHPEDVHKLEHVNRPIQIEDITYSARKLSNDAYLDIESALEKREKELKKLKKIVSKPKRARV